MPVLETTPSQYAATLQVTHFRGATVIGLSLDRQLPVDPQLLTSMSNTHGDEIRDLYVHLVAFPPRVNAAGDLCRPMVASCNLAPDLPCFTVDPEHHWGDTLVRFLSGLFDLLLERPFRQPSILHRGSGIHCNRSGWISVEFDHTSTIHTDPNDRRRFVQQLIRLTQTSGLSRKVTESPVERIG